MGVKYKKEQASHPSRAEAVKNSKKRRQKQRENKTEQAQKRSIGGDVAREAERRLERVSDSATKNHTHTTTIRIGFGVFLENAAGTRSSCCVPVSCVVFVIYIGRKDCTDGQGHKGKGSVSFYTF